MRDNITSVTNFRECSLWCCNKAVYRRPRRISNHKLPFYNFWNFFYSFPRLSFDDHDANVPCTHALSFQYRAFPSRLFPLVARSPARVGFKSRPDIFVLSISSPILQTDLNLYSPTFRPGNTIVGKLAKRVTRENNPREILGMESLKRNFCKNWTDFDIRL